MTAHDDELLTLEEVSDYLRGVSKRTLRRRIKDGQLRAIRVGRGFLVRKHWLDEFIDSTGGTACRDEGDTSISLASSGLENGRLVPNVGVVVLLPRWGSRT